MIDVKVIKKLKGTAGDSSSAGIGPGADNVARETRHAARADKAEHAELAEYANRAGYATRAEFSKEAQTVSEDSDIFDKFLRKDIADAARELITFLKGIAFQGGYGIDGEGKAKLLSLIVSVLQSADFDEHSQAGFGITRRKDGKYQLSITDLIVWGRAIFNELEIRKLSYVGGNMVFSSCGTKITRVETVDADGHVTTDAERRKAYRCYFFQDDGTTATTNLWKVNDQARCRTFNIKPGKYDGVSNRSYWRRVTAVGEDYIDLSRDDCEQGSDMPAAGDALVQMGNRTDTDRMSLIYVIVNGDDAPAIIWYDKVNSYTLENRRTAIISPKEVMFSSQMFKLLPVSGEPVSIVIDRGRWQKEGEYAYYERVSHLGSLWLCVAPPGITVTSEPSDGNSEWQKQVSKGDDGDSPIVLSIFTDCGNFIRNGQGQVTLTAVVTRGGEDITATFSSAAFSWIRSSGNAEYDKAWNIRHERFGNTVTVKAEDIFKRAVFECILES